MSGGLACAIVDPSTKVTIEWIDRLRVHDDVDPVVRDAEQQVRLDDLEALVDQGGRVDGDDRAHRPGRVGQRLRGGDVAPSAPLFGRGTDRRTR